MNGILFESPWIVGAFGAILTVVTLYGWLQSGNSVALRVGIAMCVVTVLLVLLNVWVVTDRETIRALVLDVAGELERNEVANVKRRFHPNASQVVLDAGQQLDSLKFSMARVKTIHAIDLKKRGSEEMASVRMNVYVEVERAGFQARLPRWVQVNFEKHQGKWLVVDFQEREPQHEFLTEEGKSRLQGVLKN